MHLGVLYPPCGAECGIGVETIACFDYDGGPAAARLGDERLPERLGRMAVPGEVAGCLPGAACNAARTPSE